MTKTNHPNPGFNLSPDILFDRKLPIKIPTIAQTDMVIKSVQLKSIIWLSPKNPNNDFAAMITRDVPTDYR